MKTKTKKSFSFFLICFLLCCLLPAVMQADTGPKPSVKIEFQHLPEGCYVTLLSEVESTGPHSVGSEDYGDEAAAFDAFSSYQDSDGFYFLGYYSRVKENVFAWNYYPPERFKVAWWDPATQEVTVMDEILERYAFDSYYFLDLQKVPVARKNYDYQAEIFGLICRVVLTLLVELSLALLFRFGQKRNVLLLLGLNLTTQILLNLVILPAGYMNGPVRFFSLYWMMELLILVLEGAFCLFFLPKQAETSAGIKKTHPILYALTANLLSFGLGLWLSLLIPSVF